jgi:negative regulator of genetic competence, sporulation and motility
MGKKKTTEETQTAMLSKYFNAENRELLRSEIHFAEYNPRIIDEDELKNLRKGIKKFGLVGGLVVNKRTGNTIVQGHQRISVLDSLQKYNPDTKENDYRIRADVVDVDEGSEMELNVLLNNPNAQGKWDYDRLKAIVPKINVANAGLTDADLAMMGIGLEQNLAAIKTAAVPTITSAMMSGAAKPSDEKPVWKELPGDTPVDDVVNVLLGKETPEEAEKARQAKIQHMKDVKEQANQQAQEKAEQAAAYLMLSFDNMDNMQDFLARFNLPEHTQIVKGEELLSMLEEQE